MTTRARLLGAAGAPAAEAADWSRVLAWFLRFLGATSMLRGLYHWAVICGFVLVNGTAFEDQPMALQSAVIFFAVIDLVAGVGLWLAAAWGGAVWILAALIAFAIDMAAYSGGWATADILARPVAASVADLVLIAAYLVFTTLASRQVRRGGLGPAMAPD